MKADQDIIFKATIQLLTRPMSTVENPDWAIKAATTVFEKVYGRKPEGIGKKD